MMPFTPFTDRVNRRSALPLYQQIYEQLRGKISGGQLKPGDALPTEADLVEQYQVSRATVRQALDALVQDGLIYRERGRGTFVAHPTVQQGLTRLVSFTEDMRSRGFEPGSRVLSAQLVPASEEMAGRLDVEPGEELARIERLRLADGEPMSIESSYLIHRVCPGILRHDYAANSLRQMLEQHYDVRIASASQAIRAVEATGELANLLSVRRGAALLFIERVSYSQYGLPVELLYLYHRGDRYVLYNELRG
jgi:GntR family transcriptional regulator